MVNCMQLDPRLDGEMARFLYAKMALVRMALMLIPGVFFFITGYERPSRRPHTFYIQKKMSCFAIVHYLFLLHVSAQIGKDTIRKPVYLNFSFRSKQFTNCGQGARYRAL